ncbi:MAG: tetratricopeptide repeat protein [Acidobacteriota bacterium]
MKNKLFFLVTVIIALTITGLVIIQFTKTSVEIILPEIPEKISKNIVLKKNIEKLLLEIKEDHKNGEKIGELGKLYHANMYFSEALDCYRLAQKIDNKNPYWKYFDAYIGQKMGKLDKNATNLLQQTIKIRPDYFPAILKLGDIFFKLGQFERSGEEYKKILNSDDISQYAYLGLARLELRKKNWDKAKELLLKSTGIDPKFGIAYRLLAEVHKQFNETDQMKLYRSKSKAYRFSEAPDPWVDSLVNYCYDETELIRLSDSLFKMRKIERAIEIAERTAKIFPKNLENYRIAGSDLLSLGYYEKAAEYFEKIIQLNKNDVEAMVNKGAAFLSLNRLEEAGELIFKALKMNPESSLAMYNAGYLFFKKRDIKKAEEYFEKTIKADPKNAKAYFNMGIIKKGQKHHAEATSLFKSALKIKNSMRGANLHIALMNLMDGNKEEGIKYLFEELDINPESFTTCYFLANEFSDQGNFEKAEKYYKNAININPDLIEARANLANLYEHLGRSQKAVEQYRALVLINPNELKWKYLLGKSLLSAGNNSEGIITLKTVLQAARENNNTYLAEIIEKIMTKER